MKAILLLLCLQDPNLPPKQDDIDKALERSAQWLLGCVQQGLPGDVAINGGQGLNYNALVLYALHHAGADKEDASFKRLLDTVANAKITRTYTAATTAMALTAIDRKKYRYKIYECGQFLADNMCDNGQWSYGTEYEIPKMKFDDSGTMANVIIKRQKALGGKAGDNSNSQYAALGLRACGLAGFEFEKSFLDKPIAWWETSQKADGSWDYGEKGATKESDPGFGSMTAGGAASVAILRKLKGQSGKFQAVTKASGWLATNFSVTENPCAPDDRKRFHYYYLYALERVGDITPVDKFGKHHWYAQGAHWLLKNQKGGMWELGGVGSMPLADTCFAVLFLKRATRVATGDHK